MRFHRSPSGLSNFHRFVGVDCVVFVEGGNDQFSLDEVIDGAYSPGTLDVKFWNGIFSIYLGENRKHQLRAIGSKPTLRSIADLISNKAVSNVWVAMDRDHDYFRGRLIIAPGVFYTCGYSWENDACVPEVIEDVFWAIAQLARGSIPVRTEIDRLFATILGDIKTSVQLDVAASIVDDSVLPRQKPFSICQLSGRHDEPSVNRIQLAGLIRNFRKKYSGNALPSVEVEVDRDCVGHVLACFCYRILRFLIKKYSDLGNIQQQLISNLIIDRFHVYLDINRSGVIYAHYAGQFSLLGVELAGAAQPTDNGSTSFLHRLFSLFRLSRAKR